MTHNTEHADGRYMTDCELNEILTHHENEQLQQAIPILEAEAWQEIDPTRSADLLKEVHNMKETRPLTPTVQDAPVTPKNKGGRPRKNAVIDSFEDALTALDREIARDEPNEKRIRAIERKLDTLKYLDERRNNQTRTENSALREQVKTLEQTVAEVQIKADGYDAAVEQTKIASHAKSVSESELAKVRNELQTASSRAHGLTSLSKFIASTVENANKKLFALKIFLALGSKLPDDCYAVFGVFDDIPLWQQLSRTWSDLKPDRLVQIYADLAPSATDQRWFLKHRLEIEFSVNVQEKMREQQQRDREREEKQEQWRENQRIEAGAKAERRLQDSERDLAGRPTFGPYSPKVEYVR